MTNGYLGGVNAFGNGDWCQNDPQVCSYEGMQERVMGTYVNLSDQLDAEIAPGGVLWKIIMTKNNSITFHDPDGIHPSLEGSYANAIAIYSVVAKKPVTSIFIPDNLQTDKATLIQNTIAEALFECNPNWRNFDLRK